MRHTTRADVPGDPALPGFCDQLSSVGTIAAGPAINNPVDREDDMPKGHWIARVDVADPEKYKAYIEANAQPLSKYGARFLVRGGEFENPEGASRGRNVVLEFPTSQAAIDCWHSPEYQQALKFRQAAATCDLIIIAGHDRP